MFLILSTDIEFRHFKDAKERNWWIINEREAIVGKGDIAARSALQRVEEVMSKRAELQAVKPHAAGNKDKKVSTKDLCLALLQQYDNIKWAASTDPMTASVIDTCCTIHDRLLCHDTCRMIVLKAERFFAEKGLSKKSPFTLGKMEHIIKNSRNKKLIEWSLSSMLFEVPP